MSDDMNDWNQQIIAEFRANEGKVGGPFEGAPMVLVSHKGARTGTERVTPLMALLNGDDIVIFASKAGAPDNPDWYHNLVANPRATSRTMSDPHTIIAGTFVANVRRLVSDARMPSVFRSSIIGTETTLMANTSSAKNPPTQR